MRKAALFSLALFALPSPFFAGAAAARPPVVVELYTAQGCASCGEANAHVAKLADKPGVLALTFSVDYWDYLGWADTFAKPEFAERQKAYVAKLSLREPYTPQVVVDGAAQASGAKPDKVDALVADAGKARRDPPDIRFAKGRVYVGSARAPKGGGEVWLVRYDPRVQDVAVKAGDNKGQTIPQKNVVRELKRLGAWRGKPVAFRLPAAGEEGLKTVVLVQAGHGGRVLGVGAPVWRRPRPDFARPWGPPMRPYENPRGCSAPAGVRIWRRSTRRSARPPIQGGWGGCSGSGTAVSDQPTLAISAPHRALAGRE